MQLPATPSYNLMPMKAAAIEYYIQESRTHIIFEAPEEVCVCCSIKFLILLERVHTALPNHRVLVHCVIVLGHKQLLLPMECLCMQVTGIL